MSIIFKFDSIDAKNWKSETCVPGWFMKGDVVTLQLVIGWMVIEVITLCITIIN